MQDADALLGRRKYDVVRDNVVSDHQTVAQRKLRCVHKSVSGVLSQSQAETNVYVVNVNATKCRQIGLPFTLLRITRAHPYRTYAKGIFQPLPVAHIVHMQDLQNPNPPLPSVRTYNTDGPPSTFAIC